MINFMLKTDPELYYFINLFGTFMFLTYTLLQLKKVKIIPGRFAKKLINFTESKNSKIPMATIAAVFEVFVYIGTNYYFGTDYIKIFGKLLDMGPNYFGLVFISPFVFAAVCFILGIDIVKAYDIHAPGYALALTISKIACFCAGCCRGIEWEHGIYNYSSELVEFPVQLVEAGLALITFIILFSIRNKAKPGTLFPLYVILYSGTRFFSEFFRHEPEVFGGLKLYHWCCIAGVVFGVILLLIAIFFSEKISRLFTVDICLPKNIPAEISYNYHSLKNKVFKKNNKPVHHNKKKMKK